MNKKKILNRFNIIKEDMAISSACVTKLLEYNTCKTELRNLCCAIKHAKNWKENDKWIIGGGAATVAGGVATAVAVAKVGVEAGSLIFLLGPIGILIGVAVLVGGIVAWLITTVSLEDLIKQCASKKTECAAKFAAHHVVCEPAHRLPEYDCDCA